MPLCDEYVCRGPIRGLMRHLTCAHADQAIDHQTRRVLTALERGVCPDPSCCALRPLSGASSRTCSRCSCSLPPRPILDTDRIPAVRPLVGLRRPSANSEPNWMTAAQMPLRFLHRIRAMPSGTVPHMPVRVREAICDITAECLMGICKGNSMRLISRRLGRSCFSRTFRKAATN